MMRTESLKCRSITYVLKQVTPHKNIPNDQETYLLKQVIPHKTIQAYLQQIQLL